jgi:precorrin-6B methylase 2
MGNSTTIRPLSAIKNLLVPAGRRPRRVWFGLYRDLRLNLDLRSQSQMLVGLWERETYSFVRSVSSKVDWFIDVGAGSGEMCLFFLKGSKSVQVIAVEPDAREVSELRRHLQLNGFSDTACQIHERAVRLDGQGITLDDLPVDGAARGFIKIDVDGAELDVLKSGERLLSGSQIALLIETHSAALETDCIAWLERRGFATKVIKNAWWRLLIPEYRTIEHNRWLAAWKKPFKPDLR